MGDKNPKTQQKAKKQKEVKAEAEAEAQAKNKQNLQKRRSEVSKKPRMNPNFAGRLYGWC